jgi:SAM-dependent methyltransferase
MTDALTTHAPAIAARVAAWWPADDLKGLRALAVGPGAGALIPAAFWAAPAPAVRDGRVVAAAPGALPFEAASVDCIVATAPLALGEVWRVLRPQGRVIVVVPRAMVSGPALRAALARAKLRPARMAGVGGWPLFRAILVAEAHKQVFAPTPPRRGARLRLPQLLPGLAAPGRA